MARKIKPVHPGEILREEFMEPLGLSMNRMAIDFARAGDPRGGYRK
jgi:plasmid maintenance system antidote protein VapI